MKKNYFECLDVQSRIKISFDKLETAYINACALNSHNANDLAYINEAFHELKNDTRRIAYALSLHLENLEIDRANRQQFAFEFFEINEEIDNICDVTQLEPIKLKLNGEFGNIISKIDDFYKQEDYKKALEYFSKLKYIDRILNNIDCKIHFIEDKK